MGNQTNVSDCLKFLEQAGWSELIDPRWRRQIEKELRMEFGECLTEDILHQVVSAVLYPN